MKKALKRILSLLLVLALTASFSVCAFATTPPIRNI